MVFQKTSDFQKSLVFGQVCRAVCTEMQLFPPQERLTCWKFRCYWDWGGGGLWSDLGGGALGYLGWASEVDR